jgi:hypothetical protein
MLNQLNTRTNLPLLNILISYGEELTAAILTLFGGSLLVSCQKGKVVPVLNELSTTP